MAFDLVVRNGVIVDGTGAPGFAGDVGVEGERITAIGPNLGPGKTEINAHGNVIAPGFIDPHTHMDQFLLQFPHGNPVVNYGVTTIVIGDCGASVAPVPSGAEPLEVLVKYLKRVLDDYIDASSWQWKTFPEYLNYLNGRVGVNVAAFMPHSPVRLTVMGEAAYQREATADELEAMKRMVREGLEAGAIGFSSSPRGGPEIHAGTPSTVASYDEIVELANLAADFGGSFQFNGFGNLIKDGSGYDELMNRIRAPLIGNEFRLRPGELNDGPRSIQYMEALNRRGKDICGIVIPYQHIRRFDVNDSFIFDGLPTWDAAKGSPDALQQQLQRPEVRARIEIERIQGAGKPAFPDWGGWGNVVIDRVENPSLKALENKSVEEVAREAGKSPADAFFDTWLADDLRSRFIYHGLANQDLGVLEDMITSPTGLIGTDAGAHLERFFWYGTPARLLGYWTREQKLLGLEEAVHKLTGFAAEKIHVNRGQLRVGWPADITIFDPDRIDDLVTARLPEKVNEHEVMRHPPGIQAVIVNGQTVVEGGECMDVLPGKTTKGQLSPPVPA
jgi:N-acyl-D-aspartate/D-glutamate deacylase